MGAVGVCPSVTGAPQRDDDWKERDWWKPALLLAVMWALVGLGATFPALRSEAVSLPCFGILLALALLWATRWADTGPSAREQKCEHNRDQDH
jgi:hypothetical protein